MLPQLGRRPGGCSSARRHGAATAARTRTTRAGAGPRAAARSTSIGVVEQLGEQSRRARRAPAAASRRCWSAGRAARRRRPGSRRGRGRRSARWWPATAARRARRPAPRTRRSGAEHRRAARRRGRRLGVGVGPVLDARRAGTGRRAATSTTRIRRTPTATSAQRPSGSSRGLDDAGHGADVGADVAAADLAPPLDQHDAELARSPARQSLRPAPGSAARRRAAAGQPREQHRAEREHRAAARQPSSTRAEGGDVGHLRPAPARASAERLLRAVDRRWPAMASPGRARSR